MYSSNIKEFAVGTLEQGAVYDTLVDLLVQGGNRQEILLFCLGSEPQGRLDELLEKNRIGAITPEEASELETFEHFEHVVRLLKARVLQSQQP
ncbi:MAG: hypothetical protein ACK449_16710 [Planctomycetota bacterium]|jgi:hypothetical protein